MATINFNESTISTAPDEEAIVAELRDRLTETAIKCSERCLYHSAKWTAELLDALPEAEDVDSQMLGADVPTSSYRLLSTSYEDPHEAALESKEASKYLLAKSYFDTKEYDRCASVFLPPAVPAGGLAIFEKSKARTPVSTPSKKNKMKTTDAPPTPKLSQKSLFLALYARYLAGEKRKDEGSEMILGPNDGGQSTNQELSGLVKILDDYFRTRDAADPQLKRSQGWLEYLYGTVLAKSKQEDLAQEWLLRAVRLNPYHWGAWEELSHLLASVDDLNAQLDSGILPQNVMRLMYQVHANIDLFSTTDSTWTVNSLNSLLKIFPNSTFLQTQQALFHYHSKDFEMSSSIFQDILIHNPYRLDGLDHYSNILYVMSDRPKLAFLAHLATSVDKFRPETCCVVGNYYSLCSHHEKAVMYFRRALTLDRSFLSAWTLMGHEYIELKNTHAAIESYRRAVDVNRKDYRAWYGLGQAYELLDMGFYALFYYQRAAGLRPYDAKMWQAVGSCFAKMNRTDQAIKALKRALAASTYYETDSPSQSFNTSFGGPKGKHSKRSSGRKLLDPETLFHIAQLYERRSNEAEAARYMELCLAQETGQSGAGGKGAQTRANKRNQKGKGASFTATDASDKMDGDGDTDILSSSPSSDATEPISPEAVRSGGRDEVSDGFGTGTTATTSRARLWLARYAFKQNDLDRAEQLAEELCMDGFEVEEAKGLVREVRGRREAMATSMTSPFVGD